MDAFLALHKAASGLSDKDKKLENRRGPFPSIPHGISFGGGQPVRATLLPNALKLTVQAGASVPHAQL